MCTCMHALTPSISIWMHPSKSGIWSNCQHLWHKLLDPSLQSMSSANTWMQGLRTKIDELQKVAFRLFEQKVFQPMGKENHTGKWFGYWHLLNKYWILCEFSWANLWVCQLSGPTFANLRTKLNITMYHTDTCHKRNRTTFEVTWQKGQWPTHVTASPSHHGCNSPPTASVEPWRLASWRDLLKGDNPRCQATASAAACSVKRFNLGDSKIKLSSNMEHPRLSTLNEIPLIPFFATSLKFEGHCISSNIFKYTDWSRWSLIILIQLQDHIRIDHKWSQMCSMLHKSTLLSNFCTRPKSSPPDLAVSHFSGRQQRQYDMTCYIYIYIMYW